MIAEDADLIGRVVAEVVRRRTAGFSPLARLAVNLIVGRCLPDAVRLTLAVADILTRYRSTGIVGQAGDDPDVIGAFSGVVTAPHA